MFIILTAEQNSQVAGDTGLGARLEPRMCVDGTYALPVEVLQDPSHESVRDFLSNLPQQEEEPMWYAHEE